MWGRAAGYLRREQAQAVEGGNADEGACIPAFSCLSFSHQQMWRGMGGG